MRGKADGWRDRIVWHGRETPDKLLPNARNWRRHPERQRAALAGVLSKVGWVQEVIVNRRTGRLVDGHLRVALAIERAERKIPVSYVDLSAAEEAIVLATLDPLAALAEADPEKLERLLQQVHFADPAVTDMLAELARNAGILLGGEEQAVEVPAEIERAAELQKKWRTKQGQAWEIPSKTVGGKTHRLVCGDSTSPGDVVKALAGARPLLMVTDPPYGVEYDPLWRERAGLGIQKQRSKIRNDQVNVDWRRAYELFSGDVAYVWHASVHAGTVSAGLATAGFDVRAQLVWVKQNFALSRGDYHWGHEPCWYAVRRQKKSSWNGDRAQSTVWFVDNLGAAGRRQQTPLDEKTGHGTQKPVELFARSIRNHKARELYEPFAGSGTAFVAAEQLNRVCFGLEIEPGYVAVTLERLVSMGLEPKLARRA